MKDHFDTSTAKGQALQRSLEKYMLRTCDYCAHPRMYHGKDGFCAVCRELQAGYAEYDEEYKSECA